MSLCFDFCEIASVPSVSSSINFGGKYIRFTIEQPENICYNGNNCYGSLQFRIFQTRENSAYHPLEPIINAGTRAQPACVSVPHICPNPAGAIFDSIKCNLKGTEISNIQY